MERRSLLKTAMMGMPFIAAQKICEGKSSDFAEIEFTIPEGLRQEVWEIAQAPGRLSRLCPEARHYEEDRATSHAYALYVENGNRVAVLDWSPSYEEMVAPTVTFRDLMTRLAPKTWKDLKFGFDLYRMGIVEWTTPECSAKKGPFWSDPLGNWPEFRPMKVVDALLEDTRGALLRAEQLHGLYILCDPNREAAIRFRKALHAGKPEAWERLRNLHFADGTSLEVVLDERMLFGHTYHPDYLAFAFLVEHFVRQTTDRISSARMRARNQA